MIDRTPAEVEAALVSTLTDLCERGAPDGFYALYDISTRAKVCTTAEAKVVLDRLAEGAGYQCVRVHGAPFYRTRRVF